MRLDGNTHRRKAVKLSIGHLSAVDQPAHEGAQAVIMKAKAPTEGEKILKSAFSVALEEQKLDKQVAEMLENTWRYNHALREAAEDIAKDESISDKQAALREAVSEYVATLTAAMTGSAPEGETTKEADMADEKELAKYKALASMNDVQKAHHASLTGDEADQYMALSSEERDEIANIAKAADETYTTTDGEQIVKSKVGSQVFALLKSQDQKLAKMRDEQLTEKFAKRAETELKHLPGETVAKAAALRAIDGMDESVRKTLEQILKAADAAAAPGYKPAAAAAGSEEIEPADKLEKMVDEHMQKNAKLSRTQAYSAVLATDEGKQLYKQSLGE